tara:strand:- start:2494 stop:3366 length:873 start_codon:yes stop_codon:yes gene_type:complete
METGTVSSGLSGFSGFSGFSERMTGVVEWGKEGGIAAQIFTGIAIVIVLYFIINFVFSTVGRIVNMYISTPLIIDGMSTASKGVTISQNPNNGNARLLRRSANEKNGIEFTYSTWMNIDNWENQNNRWKHVFHKGTKFNIPSTGDTPPHEWCEIQAPGLWIHPDKNSLRLYMNTYLQNDVYIDVDNIPISKWFHIAIVFSHRNADIYINGFLKKRLKLDNIPRQNYYNLMISKQGGFSGMYSNFQYFNYALSMTQLQLIVRRGPNFKSYQADPNRKEFKPYLSNQWWISN